MSRCVLLLVFAVFSWLALAAPVNHQVSDIPPLHPEPDVGATNHTASDRLNGPENASDQREYSQSHEGFTEAIWDSVSPDFTAVERSKHALETYEDFRARASLRSAEPSELRRPIGEDRTEPQEVASFTIAPADTVIPHGIGGDWEDVDLTTSDTFSDYPNDSTGFTRAVLDTTSDDPLRARKGRYALRTNKDFASREKGLSQSHEEDEVEYDCVGPGLRFFGLFSCQAGKRKTSI